MFVGIAIETENEYLEWKDHIVYSNSSYFKVMDEFAVDSKQEGIFLIFCLNVSKVIG